MLRRELKLASVSIKTIQSVRLISFGWTVAIMLAQVRDKYYWVRLISSLWRLLSIAKKILTFALIFPAPHYNTQSYYKRCQKN